MKEQSNITNLEPTDFEEEVTTMWSFPERGGWATHSPEFRGNWAPQVVRNLIFKYSKAGEIVLDNFCGAGTTAIEAKLMGRKCLAIDINESAVKLTKGNLHFKTGEKFVHNPRVQVGDARELKGVPDNQIDLICSHPPYANAIKYSKATPGDLSLLGVDDFLAAMKDVAEESSRVLKLGGHCAVLIADLRKQKRVVPLGQKVMSVYEAAHFKLKEIVIKEQHNCSKTGEWAEKAKKYGFLLLAHEYLFIFDKP